MNVIAAEKCVAAMSILKFFPSDPAARGQLVCMLMDMCQYEEQAEWLVNRMPTLFNEWPGPRELRAVFCSRFPPKDRLEVSGTSPYPDGIPHENCDPELPMLPSGSADSEMQKFLDDTLAKMEEKHAMPRV